MAAARILLLALLTIAALPSTARAQDAAPLTPYPASYPLDPVSVPRWYGWQTMLSDVASVILIGKGLSKDSMLADVGAATYVLGGPTVHWAHSHVALGFEDLALRVGLPFGAALGGLALSYATCGSAGPYEDEDHTVATCRIGPTLGAGIVGAFAAAVIDAGALANDTTLEVPKAASSPPAWLIAPAPMVGGGRLGIEMVGMF